MATGFKIDKGIRPTHGVPNIPGHHPHRIFANDDAEQIQRDPAPVVEFTASEMKTAFFVGGVCGVFIACIAMIVSAAMWA